MKNDSEQKLKAICILDGRNKDKLEEVSKYFSEFALIRYRIRIEVEYLIFLSKNTKIIRNLASKEINFLQNIWKNFQLKDALIVKQFEAQTNHDVKAVEYFLQKKIKKTTLKDFIPFIHFGLTSYDINIPAYALMLVGFNECVISPTLHKLLKLLREKIEETKNMPMLARTHGQPALPTTMGKELSVFYKRILKEVEHLKNFQFEGKLTGAVCNFNALDFVYPQYDWISSSRKFIRSLGLLPNVITTQILPYDNWLEFFDLLKRLNNIMVGLCQDIWWYISFEYFLQRKKKEEVGSSTMSHKVNPITFENAEGNLQLANALFEFFVRKLSVSRLQRDLSDSTIKRDFGLAFGFTILAWDSLFAGLSRITPNVQKMQEDLNNHWEIYSEGVQTYLRSLGKDQAFEILKEKTRGKTFNKSQFHKLIDTLPIDEKDKKNLKIKSLAEYLGLAKSITDIALKNY